MFKCDVNDGIDNSFNVLNSSNIQSEKVMTTWDGVKVLSNQFQGVDILEQGKDSLYTWSQYQHLRLPSTLLEA